MTLVEFLDADGKGWRALCDGWRVAEERIVDIDHYFGMKQVIPTKDFRCKFFLGTVAVRADSVPLEKVLKNPITTGDPSCAPSCQVRVDGQLISKEFIFETLVYEEGLIQMEGVSRG